MMRALVTEGWSLLEGAAALAVDEFEPAKLGRLAAYGYTDSDEAKKTGVLFVHWKQSMKPRYLDMLKRDWPEDKMKIAVEIPKMWRFSLFNAVHNQIDSDWNDGEPYEDNDPTTIWPADVRKWWSAFDGKLKSVTFEISDIIVSPKSGLPGFKITMNPPLASLPKYTGKRIKPVV
jgi:hypothetical protein